MTRPATETMGPWQAGDVLLFWGADPLSWVIRWGTWGPSHVGIVIEYQGQLALLESTTLCDIPCLYQGRVVAGVQVHLIADRVARYRGTVQVMSLMPECALSPVDVDEMTVDVLKHYLAVGASYDLTGAVLSATWVAKYLAVLPFPDPDSLFCSALVARLLMVRNRMNWDDPGRYSPAGLVRTLRRTGVYSAPRTVVPERNDEARWGKGVFPRFLAECAGRISPVENSSDECRWVFVPPVGSVP